MWGVKKSLKKSASLEFLITSPAVMPARLSPKSGRKSRPCIHSHSTPSTVAAPLAVLPKPRFLPDRLARARERRALCALWGGGTGTVELWGQRRRKKTHSSHVLHRGSHLLYCHSHCYCLHRHKFCHIVLCPTMIYGSLLIFERLWHLPNMDIHQNSWCVWKENQ